MQRVLRFDGSAESKERFALVYQGFVLGGNGAERKGMETVRREAKMLDQFDAISVRPLDVPADLEGVRQLRPGAHELVFDVPEFDLLKRYFEAVTWKTSASRIVVAVADWLASIPLEEPRKDGAAVAPPAP